MTCIFGSTGKIGSLFKIIYPDAQCPHHTNPIFSKCSKYIFCNHNIKDYSQIVRFTNEMLVHIPNSEDVILVNIASDAEIIQIPTRIQYGNIKKEFRYSLEKRRNRVVNIFFPHVKQSNMVELLSQLRMIDFSRDFYYLSDVSRIFKPIWSSIPSVVIQSDIQWTQSQYCIKEKFSSEVVQNGQFYDQVRREVENAYRLDLVSHDQLHLGMLSWQLIFQGAKPDGKVHVDMKRCLFGNLFRAIVCVENDSDNQLLIGETMYQMKRGDIIVIPDGVRHQPLKTSHGSRKIIICDLFTSHVPDYFKILLFYIFNNLKFIGIEV